MRYVGMLLAVLPVVALAQPYPLCPGTSWNLRSGEPTEAANDPITFDSLQPGDQYGLGSHRDWGLAIQPPARQSNAISSKPTVSATVELTNAVKGQIQSPGVLARLNDASAALNVLSPPEQKILVERALSLFPNGGKATEKATPAVLEERLKLIKVQAQLAGLQKILDPMTLRAYLDRPSSALSEAELIEKFRDTSFRAMSLRLAPAVHENLMLRLKLGSGNVQIVGVGEGVRPGGLSLVPRPQPVAFGRLPDGALCVRPAVKSDWKLDPASNKIHRAWDPKGFRDVGLLLWRTKDGKGPVGNSKICSFVRVGGVFALTAAHCVIDSGAGAPIHKRNYLSPGLEAVALLPRLDQPDLNPEACFDQPTQCGYFVSKVEKVELPVGISWPSVASGPSADVALLTLPFGADAPVATTGVSSGGKQVDRLTLAGYGLASAAGAYDWGSLLVGWQQRPPQLDASSLIWSVDVNNGAAGGCGGDSGGAVYEGDIAGLPNEIRVLAGVISSGELPQTGEAEVGRCAASRKGRAARLDVHFPWLCKQSNNIVLGCPGNELATAK